MPDLKRASASAIDRRSSSSTTSSTPKCVRSAALAPNQRCSRIQAPRASESMAVRSATGLVPLLEQEPVEAARGEREQIGQLADLREARAPEHLLGEAPGVVREVELDRLRRAREVVHAQRDVVLPPADVGEDAVVGAALRLVGPHAEDG